MSGPITVTNLLHALVCTFVFVERYSPVAFFLNFLIFFLFFSCPSCTEVGCVETCSEARFRGAPGDGFFRWARQRQAYAPAERLIDWLIRRDESLGEIRCLLRLYFISVIVGCWHMYNRYSNMLLMSPIWFLDNVGSRWPTVLCYKPCLHVTS